MFGRQVKTNIVGKLYKIFKHTIDNNLKINKILNTRMIRFGFGISKNVKRLMLDWHYKILNRYHSSIRLNTNNPTILQNGGFGGTYICRCKKACPVGGNKCITYNVVHLAEVDIGYGIFRYIGSTSRTLRERIYSHKYMFKHVRLKNATSLSGDLSMRTWFSF